MNDDFARERADILALGRNDAEWQSLSRAWRIRSSYRKYTYNFDWTGLPIIQNPVDMAALHDIIWRTRPDLIIECGVARGGSLAFYASMLELNAVCGGPQEGRVVGIDIDIRPHNRRALEAHPLFRRMALVEGSSVAPETANLVRSLAGGRQSVMAVLDSNHSHEHVAAELELYAPLVTPGNYCVVFDTFIEEMPAGSFPGRPWDKGDNPMTAVAAFLAGHPEFAAEGAMDARLQISMAPGGYLRRLDSTGSKGPAAGGGHAL